MSKYQTILLTAAITFTIFAIILKVEPKAIPFGSVNYGGEYQSTTTKTAVGGVVLTDPTNLCPNGGGVLGSVVITGANTGVLNFYNGTTTTAHLGTATSSIAVLPASLAAGVYTFDVVSPLGLIVDLDAGLMPTSTITYRCTN